jgi:hypothetical protein
MGVALGFGALAVGAFTWVSVAGRANSIDLAPTTKAGALRTAQQVLDEIQLPDNSRASSFHALGSPRAVDLDFYGIGQDGTTNRIRFWTVPLGLDATAKFFERHEPKGLIAGPPSIDLVRNAAGFYLGSVTFESLPFTPIPNYDDSFTRLTFNLLMSPGNSHLTDVLEGVEVYWQPRTPVHF